MKNKVLGRLEPKAASFGFTKEELTSVSETIAEILPSDATDEAIDQMVERFLPTLKLSQSASHRAFARMKEQFEKEHPTNTPPAPVTPTPPAPVNPNDEMPAWFKAYVEKTNQETAALKDQIAQMSKAKTHEGLMAKALEGLKGVDESYYKLPLKGRTFETEQEVSDFVNEVKTGWADLCKAQNIVNQAGVTPPGSGPAPETVSPGVQKRVEARKDSAPKVIRGLSE